jgi:radical SAM protein with 4Fe4S-binding SPASM domain
LVAAAIGVLETFLLMPKQTTIQRSFPLNKTVRIPRRLAEYRRGDHFLFVAIAKATYVTTSSIGAEFVYLFEREVSVGEALASVTAKLGASRAAAVQSALSELLVQIETRQFYEDASMREPVYAQTILMRLTNRCNLNCTHCLVSSSPDWPTDNELTTDQWFKIVSDYASFMDIHAANSLRRLTITGGEALIRRDALTIANHSRSLGIRTELYSNGALIVNSRIACDIAESVDEVQISLDGASAPVHDEIRGTGMFSRTLRGISLLKAAGVRFRVAIVVMPQNVDDLFENLAPLARTLGEGFQIKLGLAVEQGRADKSMKFSSSTEGEEYMRRIIAHLSNEGVRVPTPIRPNLMNTSCGYGKEFVIDSDGLMYGCGPRQHPIGNLKHEAFVSIAARTMRNSRMVEVDSVEGCRDCNIRYLCGGNCRLNNISKMGNANISACDLVEKERKISMLFGRASNIVPLHVLARSSAPAKQPVAGFVPLSSLA